MNLSHVVCTYVIDRINASVLAVKNCKRKAAELAQAVGTRLGPVVAVREDFYHQSSDFTSSLNQVSSHQNLTVFVPERLHQATLRITAKASVTFELQSHRHQDHIKLH